ncbi:MAG: DUF695 domain-containing protein [Kofleriaceae bacterium]
MERWAQDFDFYMARIDAKPASIVFDLAAAVHAPVATHPILLRIHVPMLAPRPDGLRAAAELDALSQLEDQFVERLETKVDAIYVGRIVFDGATILYLYVPAHHQAELAELPALTGEPPPGYAPSWSIDDDPAWDHHAFLQPDAYARQSIWNRRLVRVFADGGDQLAVPREIDHLAYFPTAEAATSAEAALTAAGFRCDGVDGVHGEVGEDGDDGDGAHGGDAAGAPADARELWSLEFHRDDALVDGRPDEFVTEILDLILPLGGTYDGWGATRRLPG